MKIKTGQGTIPLRKLFAIYSVSMITSLPGLAISPILGKLESIFHTASELQLQMLESLPSLIIIPFILLSGQLSLRINKRNLLITGTSLFFICSLIYPFADQMWLLLLDSALLGIGAGLVIPFSTGLVADYFTGRYRTQQLGLSSAINNFALVLATLLAGFLAGIHWQLSFLVYCISGVSLVFVFFLDRKPPYPPSASGNSGKHHVKMNWPVKLMLFYYLITLLVLTVPLNLSLYVRNLHLGDYETSGTLISVFFLSITLPGLILNKVLGYLKKYSIFVSMTLLSAGLILFTFKVDLALLTAGVICMGMGYGIMQPLIYDKTVKNVSPSNAVFALSLVMVMNYIAILTYPFILQWLEQWFNNDTSYFPFIIYMCLSVAFTIFTFFRRNSAVLGI